jgi:hypothetical protein
VSQGGDHLKSGQLGTADVTASTVANIGPGIDFYFAFGVIAVTAGVTAPLTILAAGVAVVLLAFTVAEFTKAEPSAGSFITYVETALGARAGVATALLVAVGYIVAARGYRPAPGGAPRQASPRRRYPETPGPGASRSVTGSDPSPVRLLPSTVSVTAPGLPSLRVTARRPVQVFEVPGPMMPWKIVAPPGVARSAQQASLTAVTEITTSRGPGRAAGGAGVLVAAGCLRAALCAVTGGMRAAAVALPAGPDATT